VFERRRRETGEQDSGARARDPGVWGAPHQIWIGVLAMMFVAGMAMTFADWILGQQADAATRPARAEQRSVDCFRK